jgi:hypothetical protein
MSRDNLAACFLIGTVALMVLAGRAQATTLTFDVAAGQEEPKTLGLVVDDHVLIQFSVVGGQSEHVLDFRLTGPDGNVLVEYKGTGDAEYRFVCDKDGDYVMHFSNVDYSENKRVFLDYELDHYVFGMPQMLFLTIVIVILCVAAVAVFILMGKPH